MNLCNNQYGVYLAYTLRSAVGKAGEELIWNMLEAAGALVYRGSVVVYLGSTQRKYDGAFKTKLDLDWTLLEIKTNGSPLVASQIKFDRLTQKIGFTRTSPTKVLIGLKTNTPYNVELIKVKFDN